MLLPLTAWGQEEVWFQANSSEGVAITFQVLSESEKTCQVAKDEYGNAAIAEETTGVTIPKTANGYTVTAIGQFAFNYRQKLTWVSLPSTLTRIDYGAFYGCSKLQSISLPNNLTSIGGSAFYDCASLTSLWIPAKVEQIDGGAFGGCSKLDYISVDGNNPYYDSRENCNAIIRTNDNLLIAGCNSTVIPATVMSINYGAFVGCETLQSITIPAGCGFVSEAAIQDCASLNSIVVEGGNEYYTSAGCNVIIEKQSNKLIVGCNSSVIPSTVTTIGGAAFRGCKYLEVITIPASVKIIGSSAFERCSSLSAVAMQSGVTTIESNAFAYCSALQKVTIPATVTELGSYTFNDCSSLTAATLPYTLATIPDGLFAGCYNLASVNIPATLATVGSYAFSSCSSLMSMPLPASVTAIGDGAFSHCSSLESFTLPPAMTAISSWMLQGCSSLTEFTIPSNVTSIGAGAFWECSGITTLEIPASVTYIGDYAFYNMKNMHYMTWKSKNPPVCPQVPFYTWPTFFIPRGTTDAYTQAGWDKVASLHEENMKVGDLYYTILSEADATVGVTRGYEVGSDGYVSQNRYEGEIVVPSTITYNGKKYTVTELCERAFEACYTYTSRTGIERKGVTAITLPPTLQRIGMNALSQTSIKSLFLPESVTSLGMYYNEYTNLYIENPFGFNNELETIVVEEGNPYYDSRNGCNAIIRKSDNTLLASSRNTVIPSTVKKLGPMSFSRSGMEHLDIPESVVEIMPYAFYDFAFMDEWPGLKSVNIPSSVKKIGEHAFSGCFRLESIEIPNSITTLEKNVFSDCYQLKSVTLSDNLVEIKERAFDGMEQLSSIHFPDKVKTIGKAAFRYTENMLAVQLPPQIETVDDGAFAHGQKLENILIPASLQSAGRLAFYTPKLKSATALSAVPATIDAEAFGTEENPLNATATLYVPAGSKASYANAQGWSRFMNIVEFSSTCKLEPQAVDAVKGATVVLPINMTDQGTIKGLQFDLILPEGISVDTDANGKLMIATTSRTSRHSVAGEKIDDNHYRFTVSSLQNRLITGTEGTVVDITLRVDNDMFTGDYEVMVSDAVLSDNNGNVKVNTAAASATVSVIPFQRGDTNGDGNVNVVDVTSTIGYILNRAPASFVKDAADVYVDGAIDIMDVTSIIDIVLGKASASARQKASRAAVGGDALSIADVTVKPGGEVELVIDASLQTSFIGFNLTMELPEGLTLKCDEEGYPLAELWVKNTGHELSSYKNGNKYTFLCTSMDLAALPASDKLMKVVLQADASLQGGTVLQGVLNNIVFSEERDGDQYPHVLDNVTFSVTVGQTAIPGDVTGDGKVNVSDVSETIGIILNKVPRTDAADVNKDGSINVSDVSAIINIILGK